MDNAPLLLGVLMILIGSGVQSAYWNNSQIINSGAYILIGVGLLLTTIGIVVWTIHQLLPVIRVSGSPPNGKKYGITIDSPSGADVVQVYKYLSVMGHYKRWPLDRTLWLFAIFDDSYHLVKKIEKTEGDQQTWSARCEVFETGAGGRLTYAVFAVGEDGDALIASYLRCGRAITDLRADAKWPAIGKLGPDFVLCAKREATLLH
jgi:hypothetical protein